MASDYYKILGITDEERQLSEEQFQNILKQKYRSNSKKWHPDKFANASEEKKKEAEEKFKEINEANEVLSDPQKRANYDQFGTAEGMPEGGFDPFGGFNPFEAFGRHGGGYGRVVKGEDIKATVNITLEEAYNGVEKEVKFFKRHICSHCNGTGSEDGQDHKCPHCHGTGRLRTQSQRGNMMMVQETTCPYCHGTGRGEVTQKCTKCHGTGYEEVQMTKKIQIPRGVPNGGYQKFEGEGDAPSDKGGNGWMTENGDLYVIINILPHSKFQRQGNDLGMKLNLNLYEAWCGCKKEIECVDGTKINVTIPELSENGKVLRVAKKGMPIYGLGGSGYGDLYLQVNYETPKKLTSKQKELLKQFYTE